MSRHLEGVLVKPANKRERFTAEEIEEIKKCMDPETGPKYFMKNYFYIQSKGNQLYQPYEFQERLIDTYHDYRFSINLMPRQTGKTTTAAGYLLWHAMFIPDSVILIAAHKYAGAQEIMQRIRYAYEFCPNFIRAGAVSYNKGSIEFENNSRIVAQATTENTGRGMSINVLYCDELAFVRPSIAEEFWTSISPTLSTTRGKAIITSTPNSDEDQFANMWRLANHTFDEHGNETDVGVNGFKAFKADWWEHPDRDEEWKKTEIATLGEERFRREHGLEFIIHDETLISSLHLIKMHGEQPLYKHGQVRWYKKPEKNKTYIVALDPSVGTGGDYAGIQVFEAPNMEQVAEWQHNLTRIPEQIQILKDVCEYIADITESDQSVYYSVENNTVGEAALVSIENVGEENIRGVFMSESKRHGNSRVFRKGFNTTNRNKISTCVKMKTLIETDKMKIKSKPLISELKSFIAHGAGYAAKEGKHDDLVMSTVLALRIANELKNYMPELESQIRDTNDTELRPMPFIVF